MANPTPRADALRAMREAKYEAQQRALKQEAVKPAAQPPAAKAAAKAPISVTPDTKVEQADITATELELTPPAEIEPKAARGKAKGATAEKSKAGAGKEKPTKKAAKKAAKKA